MPKTLKKKQGSTLSPEKRAAIQALAAKCNKAVGAEGKVLLGKDMTPIVKHPTGLLSLDYIMTGGVPEGRYVELYGSESAGKTLLSLLMAKSCQSRGDLVVVASREEFDLAWAAHNGVNVEDVVFVDTAHGDKALEVCSTMVEEGVVGLLIMDSIQAFGTRREAEGSIEDESFGGGGASQMWGRMMRRGFALANQGNKATYLGISQVRTKIGGFSRGGPPDPEPTGIYSLKHWKSVSIQTKAGEPTFVDTATGKKNLLSKEFKLKIKKNKTGVPDRVASYQYVFREHDGKPLGFDYAEDAFRMGRVYEVLENRGAWYYHNGKQLCSGEANVMDKLRKDQKFLELIRAEVRERIQSE